MSNRKNNYNSEDDVTRFKLYKSGKLWITAGVTRFIINPLKKIASITLPARNSHIDKEDTKELSDSDKKANIIKILSALGATLGGSALITNADKVSAAQVQQSVQANTQKTNTEQTVTTTNKAVVPATSQSANNASASLSSSLSDSASQSTSLSNSQSVSQSLSASASASNTTSASQSNSGSNSNTQSTSVSQSAASASSSQSLASGSQSTSASQNSSSVNYTSAAKTASTKSNNSSVSKNVSSNTTANNNTVKVSFRDLVNEYNNRLAADSQQPVTQVNKDNFLEYFGLNGSATYDQSSGTVTITPDQNNQVGNFSLKSKIDMDANFTLVGKVNLGSNPNGADGIGFAFHNGNTTDVGNAGGNLGIGGLQEALGFKLDT
ncbi:lectin-like domain-containing protein [Oenococcus alcoholitolerans]|uniref:lectin-like domain-containing protein n=1 Tax=Oenococcus alcoholitolerans TaxID=931074 RepID=UPI003F724B4B